MLHRNDHHESALPDVNSECTPCGERDWVQQYGQHLGLLYEPGANLPPEFDHLVNVQVARAPQTVAALNAPAAGRLRASAVL